MIDLNLLQNIMKEIRNNDDLLDSFSPNQFKSKINLINHIKSLNILNKDSEIVIFGCWYGSILVPAFYNDVKLITLKRLYLIKSIAINFHPRINKKIFLDLLKLISIPAIMNFF